MNKVFLSGVVSEAPRLMQQDGKRNHAEFKLAISHRLAEGSWKKEFYTIHSWNNLAVWVAQNIGSGQLVSIEGYLTRRADIEVTAREVIAGVQAKARTAEVQSECG